MKKILKHWVKHPEDIKRWFNLPSCNIGKIIKTYSEINTMWFTYRSVFPNKGTYKTIRRMYVKYTLVFIHKMELSYNAASPQKTFDYDYLHLPSVFCQEALFKINQGYVAQREVTNKLLKYLMMRANWLQKERKLCFVDEKLHITDAKNAVGFVNVIKSPEKMIEVMMLRKITNETFANIKYKDAVEKAEEWGEDNHPKYDVFLPTYETVSLFNKYATYTEVFRNRIEHCPLRPLQAQSHTGSPVYLYADAKGNVELQNSEDDMYNNVFVSIYMLPEEFFKLNPKAKYIGRKYLVGWDRHKW